MMVLMTNNTTKRKFERHFTGEINRGLRAKIREVVDGSKCGPWNRRAILSLAGTVALTAAGRSTLELVAADYDAVNGRTKPTCDCRDCYEVNLAGVAARHGA